MCVCLCVCTVWDWLTFCSCICALTTLNSADGGFWLAMSSSVSVSQLSSDSRASWNLPQCNRASCSWAERSAICKPHGKHRGHLFESQLQTAPSSSSKNSTITNTKSGWLITHAILLNGFINNHYLKAKLNQSDREYKTNNLFTEGIPLCVDFLQVILKLLGAGAFGCVLD